MAERHPNSVKGQIPVLRVGSRRFAKIAPPLGLDSVTLPPWAGESPAQTLGEGAYKTYETPGSSPDCPEIDAPPDWRWAVADWPHDRWSTWRQRVTAILAGADDQVVAEDRAEAPRADVEEIRAAELRAFEEMTRPGVWVGKTI
jgi:hypothetical protein